MIHGLRTREGRHDGGSRARGNTDAAPVEAALRLAVPARGGRGRADARRVVDDVRPRDRAPRCRRPAPVLREQGAERPARPRSDRAGTRPRRSRPFPLLGERRAAGVLVARAGACHPRARARTPARHRARVAHVIALSAYFLPSGDGLRPVAEARSPWAPDMLHGRLLAGLAARAVEGAGHDPALRVVRLTVDMFRSPPMSPLRTSARVVRDGRRVRVVDVSIYSADIEVARASALMLRTGPH